VTLAIEFGLALALGFISLLVYMMVRQTGVVSQRLALASAAASPEVPEILKPGEPCPVTEFHSYDGAARFGLPLDESQPSLLLFTAFSCTRCRGLMEALSGLPEPFKKRMILMVLDTNVAAYAGRDIRRMKLDEFRIVEAFDFATRFRIFATPFLYAIDPLNRVTLGAPIESPRDLLEAIQQADAAPAFAAELLQKEA